MVVQRGVQVKAVRPGEQQQILSSEPVFVNV
jgi:hypothetical protein